MLQHVKVYSRLQHLIKGIIGGWKRVGKATKPIAVTKRGAEAMMTKAAEIVRRIHNGVFTQQGEGIAAHVADAGAHLNSAKQQSRDFSWLVVPYMCLHTSGHDACPTTIH